MRFFLFLLPFVRLVIFNITDAAALREANVLFLNPHQIPPGEKQKALLSKCFRFSLGEGGFEPPKSVTTDLQSAPFGRSGIPPGAGDRSRTNNLLITNQLLCH